MAKPVITDKPIIDQAEFNGVTIWRKQGGSIEVSDTNYPSMKAAIQDIAAKAGVALDAEWNTQYAGWYLIQQLKNGIKPSNTKVELVDLGLSVKWASCNLGATKPEEYGRYFAWGDVNGQTWDGEKWSDGGFGDDPAYEIDANNNLKPEYDAAHVILGGSYRIPTEKECRELINNCESVWTHNYDGTGVDGRLFTSRKPGYTDKFIFLPAAGFATYDYFGLAGSDGYYWSGSFNHGRLSWSLDIHSDDVFTNGSFISDACPVRPVLE